MADVITDFYIAIAMAMAVVIVARSFLGARRSSGSQLSIRISAWYDYVDRPRAEETITALPEVCYSKPTTPRLRRGRQRAARVSFTARGELDNNNNIDDD
jgi:hypothetical protein